MAKLTAALTRRPTEPLTRLPTAVVGTGGGSGGGSLLPAGGVRIAWVGNSKDNQGNLRGMRNLTFAKLQGRAFQAAAGELSQGGTEYNSGPVPTYKDRRPAVVAQRPHIIVLGDLTNDADTWSDPATGAASMAANVQSEIDYYRGALPDVRIVVQTTPLTASMISTPAKGARVDAANDLIRNMAVANRVVIADTRALPFDPTNETVWSANSTRDGTHEIANVAFDRAAVVAAAILSLIEATDILPPSMIAPGNVNPNADLAGDAGTANGMGTVATGYVLTNNSPLTVVASTASVAGVRRQKLVLTGTGDSDTEEVLLRKASIPIALNLVDAIEVVCYMKVTHSDGVSPPIGLSSLLINGGSAANLFSRLNERTTFTSGALNGQSALTGGCLDRVLEGIMRTQALPVTTAGNTTTVDIAFRPANGQEVNLCIEIGPISLRYIPNVDDPAATVFFQSLDYDPGAGTMRLFNPPQISGTATVGSTLTAANFGVWTPGGKSVAYQWYRDAVAISGATGRTYVAAAAGAHTCEITYGGVTILVPNTINVI